MRQDETKSKITQTGHVSSYDSDRDISAYDSSKMPTAAMAPHDQLQTQLGHQQGPLPGRSPQVSPHQLAQQGSHASPEKMAEMMGGTFSICGRFNEHQNVYETISARFSRSVSPGGGISHGSKALIHCLRAVERFLGRKRAACSMANTAENDDE